MNKLNCKYLLVSVFVLMNLGLLFTSCSEEEFIIEESLTAPVLDGQANEGHGVLAEKGSNGSRDLVDVWK